MKQIFHKDEVNELVNDFLSEKISIIKLTDILNERASKATGKVIHGVLIKHRDAPEVYGGVAVHTIEGNYAVAMKDQGEAVKRIGQQVKCRQDFDYYKLVEILDYVD